MCQAPEVHDLSKRYNFDVSMFERLAAPRPSTTSGGGGGGALTGKLAPVCLQTQARMRPEFAGLLMNVYPGLRTNEARVRGNKVRIRPLVSKHWEN